MVHCAPENHHQWSDEMTQYGLQVCEYLKQCQMNRLVNDGGGGAFYAANNVQIMWKNFISISRELKLLFPGTGMKLFPGNREFPGSGIKP